MRYLLRLKSGFFLLVLFITGCQTDEAPPVYEKGTNEYINQWMLEQMQKYYYWNKYIPQGTDMSLPSGEYFERLLYAEDHFSYAFNPTEPETVPQSIKKNFGFDIGFINFEGQVYGVVLYTLSGSPAQSYGLHRGHLITAVNNIPFNQANYETLYKSLEDAETARLTVAEYTDQTGFSVPEQINLTSYFTFSQPIESDVFTIENKKIGYIQIPHFDTGQAQNFVQVFNEFKTQQADEVIVDLRYNNGGDVSSAAALCILLAPNINAGDFFIRFQGNENGGVVNQSFKEALEMNEFTISYDVLRAARPNIGRVYVLCGAHTASASEIIINNLKPFMEVITIGEKTVGKDVAGFPISDEREPDEQGWILYPSIYKIFNANEEGGYSNGIEPVVQLNELENPEVFPLGDTRELLLNKAINLILGNVGRINKKETVVQPLGKPSAGINTLPVIISR